MSHQKRERKKYKRFESQLDTIYHLMKAKGDISISVIKVSTPQCPSSSPSSPLSIETEPPTKKKKIK